MIARPSSPWAHASCSVPVVHRSRPPITRLLASAALLPVALLIVAGCVDVAKTAQFPVTAVSTVIPVVKGKAADPAILQSELQRYSDEYLSRTAAAIDNYARIVGVPEAATQALAWKLSAGSSVVNIVSGPNPTANLVDLLLLATITRTALEESWRQSPADAFETWLKASRTLETNAWSLADSFVDSTQQQELRAHIHEWWQAHGDSHRALFARPQEIISRVQQTGERAARPGSIFSMFGLDPTAGLDPAVREVTRTRLFAERAMYTAERMPLLVRLQTEVLLGQVLRHPQVAQALTNATALVQSVDRLSIASESVSQTAAQLPDRVSAERKAILDALESQEGRLRELSADLGRTLVAAESMSVSLNGTLVTFDALMKRFGAGEPSTRPPGTTAAPFRILDYAHTADRLGLMARDWDVLIKNVGSILNSPALQQQAQNLRAVADGAKADIRSLLNYAFLLGACLLLLAFALALAYRLLSAPSSGAPGQPAHPATPDSALIR